VPAGFELTGKDSKRPSESAIRARPEWVSATTSPSRWTPFEISNTRSPSFKLVSGMTQFFAGDSTHKGYRPLPAKSRPLVSPDPRIRGIPRCEILCSSCHAIYAPYLGLLHSSDFESFRREKRLPDTIVLALLQRSRAIAMSDLSTKGAFLHNRRRAASSSKEILASIRNSTIASYSVFALQPAQPGTVSELDLAGCLDLTQDVNRIGVFS
jgi:hypothetical protein